jgi:hypothetical protein
LKLARCWGCTLKEAQKRCDSREFSEWLADAIVEPWGEERADLRMAIIATVFANATTACDPVSQTSDDMLEMLTRAFPQPESLVTVEGKPNA